MTDEARWYVIHTYSGYENKVADSLAKIVDNRSMHDLIFDIKVPTETVTEIKDEKTREVERKIFPGYVLVKMIVTDDSWFTVRNIRGVTGFVGPASKPVPLTDTEVAKLGIDLSTDATEAVAQTAEKHVVEVNYAVGDTVNIISGSLEGFSGKVDEIDTGRNIVKITLSMFGRETPVELDLDQVAPAD